MNNTKQRIIDAAIASDYAAASNWIFISNEAHGWNDAAIDQYIERHCVFSGLIESVKDELDLTYMEISEILRSAQINEIMTGSK